MAEGTILIVDDESSLRRVLSDILRRRGYEPDAVETGVEAIERAREKHYDVAIIDLGLAHMSGMDVMREVRNCSPTTACIILTGRASEESAIEAVNLGAWSYMKKPFKVDQLIGSIQEAVERAEVARAPVELEDFRERLRSRLENVVGLSENILRAESLPNAQRFADVIAADARKMLQLLVSEPSGQ